LSAKKRSETEGAGDTGRSKKSEASERNTRKPRSGDLGRALRSVYDDTLRESVPDDFLNLLGKLS
jgi:Anti-sigma factor NepR